MKVYCFIRDNNISIYDRANWKARGARLKVTPLRNSFGDDITQEFIEYVRTKHEPKYDPLLNSFYNTYMYEIEL